MRAWKKNISKKVYVKNITKAWDPLKCRYVPIDLCGIISSHRSWLNDFEEREIFVKFDKVYMTIWCSKELQRADYWSGKEFNVTNRSFCIVEDKL